MDSVIRDAIREIETVVHHRGPIELQALRVSTLAERHGLSRFQFQRRFKALTGMTVRDYINHAILGQAAERLLYTDEPINSIAVASGYASQQAMTLAFKRRFGFPPSTLRDDLRLTAIHDAQGDEDEYVFDWTTRLREEPDYGRDLAVRRYTLPAMRLLVRRYHGSYLRIPEHWVRFVGELRERGIQANTAERVGLVYDDPRVTPAERVRYDCGLFWEADTVPDGFDLIELPARSHAVVWHPEGHADKSIGKPYAAILVHWLPQAGVELSEAPGLELYGLDEKLRPSQDPGLRLAVALDA